MANKNYTVWHNHIFIYIILIVLITMKPCLGFHEATSYVLEFVTLIYKQLYDIVLLHLEFLSSAYSLHFEALGSYHMWFSSVYKENM